MAISLRGSVLLTAVCFLSGSSSLAQSPVATQTAQAVQGAATILIPETFDGWYGNPSNYDQFKQKDPPTFKLVPKGGGAPTGEVWIASTSQGLIVTGKVRGGVPEWATSTDDLFAKDHVEVWLAAAPTVDMPPIGWGDDLNFPSDACEDFDDGTLDKCRTWVQRQITYRDELRRAFVRQWVFSGSEDSLPTLSMEAFATPALPKTERLPRELVPGNGVMAQAETKTGTMGPQEEHPPKLSEYSFSLTIPYSEFPPIKQIPLTDLWVKVDVFRKAGPGQKMGAWATSTPDGKWGKPETFSHVQLKHPRDFSVSPCHMPLIAANDFGRMQQTWFVPPEEQRQGVGELPTGKTWARDFLMENPQSDWGTGLPHGNSPEIEFVDRFWKELGNGDAICGPILAYRKGGKTFIYEKAGQPSNYVPGVVAEGLDTKQLDDGWLLVKTGPAATRQTKLNSQAMCGNCPMAYLEVFAIAPDGQLETALVIYEEMQGLSPNAWEADFDFSPDWRMATYFRNVENGDGEAHWSSTTYCLTGHKYLECGNKSHVEAPPTKVEGLRMD